MHLIVSDNGEGMESQTIEGLLNDFADDFPNEAHKSIGLRNVVARLKLFYNNDVQVEISSSANELTKIEICLPIIFEENGERSHV
jgi:two-component system sensor histidine kinase YesM